MSAMKNDNLLLGVVLIAGFMLYSKGARAGVTYAQPRGAGSMPGSVGSGVAQVVGGALGAIIKNSPSWFSSSPLSNPATTPPYNVVQDSPPAAEDPYNPDDNGYWT